MKKTFAVILCGCGNKDGSEIHEATFALLSIDELGAQSECFALDEPGKKRVNFLTDQPETNVEERSQLKESARIARGKIKELSELKVADFAGLIIPGGFGVAYNLSNFADKQAQATVHPKVSSVIKAFHAEKKPIGVICIAPALIALLLGREFKPLLTAGDLEDPVSKIYQELGCQVVACQATDYLVDEKNKIISSPAYMNAKSISEVKCGIEKLIRAVSELA